ncbi:MAG: hypothetical protein V3U84_06700 [Thiotrichaceae bacterium]
MRYKNKRTLAILEDLEYDSTKEAVSPKGQRGVNVYRQGIANQAKEILMEEFSGTKWKEVMALVYWGMREIAK